MEIGDRIMDLLERIWPSKIRYQLIAGVALVHLVLMTLFVYDLVSRQRSFLLKLDLDETKSILHALAINSSSWVLANDVVGLGEIIQSMKGHPDLRYAMVIDRDGKVLAHTDRSKIGLYLKDKKSLALPDGKPRDMTLHSGQELLDVAAPILTGTGEHIGWVRIGHGMEHIARNLDIVSRNGILYTVIAMLIGSVFATLLGYRLTSGLKRLLSVSDRIRNGHRDLRMDIVRGDEISGLGRGLNQMLDSMVATEQALRNNNEILQRMFDSTEFCLVLLDRDFNFLRVNCAYARACGYPQDYFPGKNHFRMYPHTENESIFRQVVMSGEPFTVSAKPFEFPDHPEWGVTYWDWSLHPLRNQDGEVESLLFVLLDVTERKRAEQEREQYFKLFQTSTDLMVIADPAGAFKKTNPACTQMLGYSEAEFASRPFVEFVHPEDRQRTVDEIAAQLQKGSSLNFENRYICKDGSVRRLSWRAIYDRSEKLTYATARDITEMKQAEEALRLANAYNRSLIEVSLDPLVTIGIDGKITDVNGATEAVTGFGRSELTGSDFSSYFTDPEKARTGYQKVFSEGSVRDYPLEIRHRNGTITPVLYNASVYRNGTGDIIGVFAAARDVTARKEAEEELRKLNQELERRVKDRTAELQDKNEELQKMNKLFVGRELRMVELKERIEELEKKYGGRT